MKIDFDSHISGIKFSTKARAPRLGAYAMCITLAGDDTTRIISRDHPDIEHNMSRELNPSECWAVPAMF